MPALFSHPPFVACGHDAPIELLTSIARVAPILVDVRGESSLPGGAEYWTRLPSNATYEDAVPLLDAGAQRIVSSSVALLSQVPANRLVLELPVGSAAPDAATLKQISGVAITASYGDLDRLERLREQLGGKASIDALDIFVLPSATPDIAATTALFKSKLGAIPALPVTSLSSIAGGTSTTDKLDVGDLFAASLTTDREDGLFSTVVHSPSGETLGLVYSSALSLAHSIASTDGKPTYYSRSRQSLWLKGATSGAYQHLLAIRRDCDGDALEFLVEPVARVGPQSHFCHTGRSAACFGPASGLARLEATLLERKASAPVGSYTARLFGDRSLLDAKIREEADEVCRAEGKDEIAGEAADLLYFLLARCASEGVSLADVAAVLDRRADKVTRRPGNAKPAFVKGSTSSTPVVVPPPNAKVNGAAPALDKIAPPPSTAERPAVNGDAPIVPPLYELSALGTEERAALLKRPLVASDEMLGRVKPIIDAVYVIASLISTRVSSYGRTDGPKATRR
jgi:phosphoribosyl-ATP pyrophosphohydrolase/phosphoribosyl-AMP cyclohydrolase/histidinol dehydrogenase